MSSNDGKVVIDTALSTEGIKKDLQTVSKTVEKEMQTATKSIDNINKSLNKVKFDNIGKQLEGVSKAIDNTNSKIDMQKKKLAELKKSFENSTDSKAKNKMQEQILNTEASIIKLESRITSLNNKEMKLKVNKDALNGLDGEFRSTSVSAVKELDKIEKKAEQTGNNVRKSMGSIVIGDGLVKVGDKISSVGNTLTSKVTLPIVGIGTAAVKMEMDAESSFAKVSTVMDESAMSASQLKTNVVDASNKSGVAVTGFNEALYETLSAGVDSGKAIEFTSNMTKLAKGGFTETTKAVDVVTSVLNAYGLSADEATNISDKLITTQNIGKVTVDQLADSIGKVIPTANAFGVNIDNVATAMSQLTKNGIQSAEATTYYNSMLNELGSSGTVADKALRELNGKGFTQLIKEGKKLPEILKMLQDYATKNGKSLNDMFGNMEGAKAALTIMKDGGTEYTEILGQMETSTGATQKAFDKTNTTKLEEAKKSFNELKNAGIELGEELIPIASEIIGEVKKMAEAFEELTPAQQESIIKFALLAATTGPLLQGVGGITTGLGGMVKVASKITPLLFGTSAATSALGVETAATTGLLGGLGLAGGATLGALALLGVGVAGVVTHNELMSKSINTSTDDLNAWEKVINSVTGNTIKSKDELQKAGLEYKEFGDNIGKDFQKKVEESTKAIGEFSLFLSNINFDGVLTANETNEFNKRVDDLCTSAINTIKSRQSETQTEMSKLFMSDDNKIDDIEKQVLQALSGQGQTQIDQVTADQKFIKDIYTNAIKERGHLTDEEKSAIKERYAEIARIELEASQEVKTKEEKSYAKYDFENRANNLSANDGSKLLKDQKAKLDEQAIKDKTTYDVKLEQLNELLATQSGKEAEATQATINKFTEKKNKVAQLEKEQWLECIATIEEQNPKLKGIYNKYTGDILSTKDKERQGVLNNMKDTYTGLSSITESGMYDLYNKSTESFENIYVAVDKTTGDIVAAVGQTADSQGAYTEQMIEDARKAAAEAKKSYGELGVALNTASSATVDASGVMTSNTGKFIAKLGELQTAADGTKYRIMNLNGTPITIETNADGTVKNLEEVKQKVDEIPISKNIEMSSNANGTSKEVGTLGDKVNGVPSKHSIEFKLFTTGENAVKAAIAAANAGGSKISYDDYMASIGKHYTGTNGGDEGLSYVNEHGWEISSGSEQIAMLGSGSKITPHMTSVNEMNQEISAQIGSTISPIIKVLTNVLGQVASNTGEIKNYTKETAANIIDSMNSNTGTFGTLQTDITNSNDAKTKADKMKVEDNSNYARVKQQIDDFESQIDDLKTKADETTSEGYKKELEAQEKVLQKKKEAASKEMELAKMVAENEIQSAKDSADARVKIAEANKDKLIKISEAVSTALKAQLEKEKSIAEKAINDEINAMETTYNNEAADIEANLKSDTDDIDAQIAALEQQSTDTSREDTRSESSNHINMLKTKMANTKSQADKDSLALQIKDAQKSMSKQEDTWNIEDEKAKLEEEKALLEEKAQAKKDNLQAEYEDAKASKEAELKTTDEYYDKLLETESLNAQTRYKMLTASNDELVALLNSYAPGWQDAGQSLADSLLTGLNSSKQSVQDAVNEMTGLRNASTSSTKSSSPYAYYDEKGNLLKGYATGTNYNTSAGLYNVDEKGWETSSGSVAYVSKGAAINNHMQSVADMKAEITRQVSAMKNSINAEQSAMKSLILGSIASSTNSLVTHNDNGLTLSIDKFVNNSSSDIEQIANELNVLRQKQKKA